MYLDLAGFRATRQGTRSEAVTFVLPVGPTGLGSGVELVEPVSVRVTLQGDADVVQAEVDAVLQLRCSCARCLEAVSFSLPVTFSECWHLERARRGVPEGEGQTWEEEPELVLHRRVASAGLDLADAFWQNATLDLPAKVLCSQDCRGLCPSCGANLNRRACACGHQEGSSAWGALRGWRPADRS